MADNQWDTLPPDEDSDLNPAGNPKRTEKPALPATIGRYRVERLLGEGGFGVVYLAYDEQLQRSVAIKVPHAERFQDVKSINLFLQEARTAAKLEHPNILPIHDVGTSG